VGIGVLQLRIHRSGHRVLEVERAVGSNRLVAREDLDGCRRRLEFGGTRHRGRHFAVADDRDIRGFRSRDRHPADGIKPLAGDGDGVPALQGS
jgi:hypothetical protein